MPRAATPPPEPAAPKLRFTWPRLPLPSWGSSPEKRTWAMILALPRGDQQALTEALAARKAELDGRLQQVGQDDRPLIHYARFALFDSLVHEPNALPSAYLLFVCNHDGSEWTFLRQLWRAIGDDPFPFNRCLGFPTRGGFAAFAWYFLRHHYPAAFSFAMYDSTVDEVKASLTVKGALRGLIEATQADTGAFATRYEKFVSEIARYL
jgi:hypothetical protein